MTLFRTKAPAPQPTRRAPRLVRAVVAAAALLALAEPASARPEFPGIVQETLALDCAPPCTVCHASTTPEADNATQPFVVNLQSWVQTLEPPIFSDATLPAALILDREQICRNMMDPACAGGMCTRPCDANGNNKSDIDDLVADTDPNPGAKLLACPKYGCGARIAPERPLRPVDGAASLVALGAACLLARRFRRA